MLDSLLPELQTLWRARGLLRTLVRREIAARNVGTAAGALWAWLQPLLTVAAYYLVFDLVFRMRLGGKAADTGVGAFLVVGALPWMAFGDGVNRAMVSLLEQAGLLQKNALPAVLFPVRSVLASTVIFAPLMLLLIPLYAGHHHWGAPLLALPALLALQMVLTVAIGFALAICAAALRDTVQVVGFLLSLGIFLSPVLYPMTQVPEAWRWVLWLNPMTALVLGYQDVLLFGHWPPAQAWLVAGLWCVLAILGLNVLVGRSKGQLVDWL